jgi:Recombination endonuclease VII
MPYKNIQEARDKARETYHQKRYGVPAPERKAKKTPEEKVAYFKEYYARPEVIQRRRDKELQRLYGISWEDKVFMYETQKGLCGFCGKQLPPVGESHLDHNHSTGEVRKLLHKQCNSIVAVFEDSPELLLTLTKYLGVENAFQVKKATKVYVRAQR